MPGASRSPSSVRRCRSRIAAPLRRAMIATIALSTFVKSASPLRRYRRIHDDRALLPPGEASREDIDPTVSRRRSKPRRQTIAEYEEDGCRRARVPGIDRYAHDRRCVRIRDTGGDVDRDRRDCERYEDEEARTARSYRILRSSFVPTSENRKRTSSRTDGMLRASTVARYVATPKSRRRISSIVATLSRAMPRDWKRAPTTYAISATSSATVA